MAKATVDAVTMNRVGQAYIALGQPREGIAILEHALDLATAKAGASSPTCC